jgi:hypothetical protein
VGRAEGGGGSVGAGGLAGVGRGGLESFLPSNLVVSKVFLVQRG